MRIVKPIILLLLTVLAFVPTLLSAAEISAFGPQQYVRTTGAPNIYTESFEAYPGEALLVIYNGEPGQKSKDDNRVTSGKITLNGEVLFTHDDFKHQTYTLEIPISLLENNSLRIELESKPGTYISLEIIQTIPDPIYDLFASDLQVDSGNCPDSVDLTLQISNTGEDSIPAGVQVAFYNGNPDENGVLIGTATSTTELFPLGVEDITLQWANPSIEEATIYARVDDDGTGAGAYEEEDETDNLIFVDATLCRVVAGDSSLSGHIIDAVNGDLLAGVKTLLHIDDNGVAGVVVASAESNDEGVFFFPDLAAGAYIVSVSNTGYIDGKCAVSLSENTQLTNQDMVLSPVLEEGEFRIVLTWKDKPVDLEAHLTEPNASGCRYHCYYFNKSTPTASLDLDDRNGYGPETITIAEKAPGTYRYYVQDFTNRNANSRWLTYSGAKVTVYSGSNEPVVFNVPNAYGNVWHVFDLDGETGEIIPVHNMTRQSEPGRIDYPTITSGAPRYAYWGSTYRYQVKAIDPDNDTLTYSLENAPDGMSIDSDTGLIEWIPFGNQIGWYYNIKVKVEDGRCGEVTQAFNVYAYSQPTANFSVSPCSGYNPGGDITLTWSTTRVSTVLIDQGIGEVPASGSMTIPSPEVPTRYTLTAFNDAALVKRYTPTAPGSTFYFSPRRITIGQSTTLYWNSPCSNSRTIDHGIGEVPVSGSTVVTPTRSGYYYISATNAGGTGRRAADIYVYIPPDHFTASPQCNFTAGAPLTLSWHINNATDVSIFPDVGEVEPTGTYVVYPTEAGSYTLTATVNGNTITRNVGFPQLPNINVWPYYSYGMDLGQSMTFSWSTSCADTITIDQGIGEVAVSGNMTVTPEILPKTYTITASNEGGSRSRVVRLYQPLPTVYLSPVPSWWMNLGETVTLKWSTNLADNVTIDQGVGEVDLNGSLTVTPESLPLIYTVTATNEAGSTVRSGRFYQNPPRGGISADPAELKVGNSTTLTWYSTNADTCSITPEIGPVDCNGSLMVTPTKPIRYYFNMVGPGGTYSRSVYVRFVAPVADLKVDPLIIKEGESTQLSWVFANATSCTIDQGIGEVELGGERSVSPTTTTTYTMKAIGPGGMATDKVTITVIPANPSPTINLSLSERIIMRGNSTLLSWIGNYADSVVIDQGIGTVATIGSTSVAPEVTTTYTAIATGPGGTTTASITVTVMQPPPTLSLTADPVSIMAGDSAVLSWTSADATGITLNQGIGNVALQGSLTVSPNTTTTYIATSVGPGGTTTKSVTVTVTHPFPTVSFSAAPSAIKYGESSTLSWSTTNAESVSIDQGVGTVDLTGSLSVHPEEDTVYTITATGLGGIVSEEAVVTVIPSPIMLTITSPSDGESLTHRGVMVKGTVTHADNLETGVVVNGVIALVYNGEFVANHVPLDEGENTVVVKATDSLGNSTQKSVSLVTTSILDTIFLTSNYSSGLPALNATLKVTSTFSFTDSPSFSIVGPQEPVFSDNEAIDSLDVTMEAPGFYFFTALVQDGNGTTYQDEMAVLVRDRDELDALLKAKWNGMRQALISGTIQEAVAFHIASVRDEYEAIYNALGDRLPTLVSQMQEIGLIFAEDGRAKYRIRKEQTINGNPEIITYYIYFYFNEDGIWRIENY